jgi:hypothetical protein
MDIKILLVAVVLAVIGLSKPAEGLFFGTPRSNCQSHNQCQYNKCVKRGSVGCGLGSKFLLSITFKKKNSNKKIQIKI